jgi:hypothetical protein
MICGQDVILLDERGTGRGSIYLVINIYQGMILMEERDDLPGWGPCEPSAPYRLTHLLLPIPTFCSNPPFKSPYSGTPFFRHYYYYWSRNSKLVYNYKICIPETKTDLDLPNSFQISNLVTIKPINSS